VVTGVWTPITCDRFSSVTRKRSLRQPGFYFCGFKFFQIFSRGRTPKKKLMDKFSPKAFCFFILIICVLADGLLTTHLLQDPRFGEANPVIALTLKIPYGFWAMRTLIVVGMLAFQSRISVEMLGYLCAGMLLVVANNLCLLAISWNC
jgi:hypothetical protein